MTQPGKEEKAYPLKGILECGVCRKRMQLKKDIWTCDCFYVHDDDVTNVCMTVLNKLYCVPEVEKAFAQQQLKEWEEKNAEQIRKNVSTQKQLEELIERRKEMDTISFLLEESRLRRMKVELKKPSYRRGEMQKIQVHDGYAVFRFECGLEVVDGMPVIKHRGRKEGKP